MDRLSVVAGAETAGVVTEIALGSGPLGTVAGGLMPVAVQAAAAVRRRWVAKAGEALEIATDLLDPGVHIVDERSPRYDERLELMARVIDAAARATLHEKIKALGHVLADGLNDDDHIDEALVLAAGLAVLEAPHVAVLDRLDVQPEPPAELIVARRDSTLGWRNEHLRHALPQLSTVLDGVIAVLTAQGLIADLRGQDWSTVQGGPTWKITPLGRRCLFLLGARG
ncbi:hypothetical protein ACI79D_14030 [Geodermatophilus sp. SYSU D00708]